MTNLFKTESLVSYLKKNYNLKTFKNYRYNSRNQLSKGINPDWLKNFSESFEIYREQTISLIQKHQYRFIPFRLKLIPTKRGKIRRVCGLNINDIFLDRLIYNYINNLSKTQLKNNVHSISLDIKQNIKMGKSYFLRLDIKNFYESLNHAYILDNVKSYGDQEFTEIINSFLTTPWIWVKKSKYEIFSVPEKNCIGVPPGSAISQGLSNMYLRTFDRFLLDYATTNGGIYYRYVDDICYLSNNKGEISKVKGLIEKELSQIKLRLNIDKSSCGNISEGFQYLGFTQSEHGIRLSEDSLKYIKSNLILLCKHICSSYNYHGEYSNWDYISFRINSVIRGFSNLWLYSPIINEKVYGIARYMCIIDDLNQIKKMDTWLRRLNKYYCYRICENAQSLKEFMKLESLYNWYFRYKKNLGSAIDLAYKRYKDCGGLCHEEHNRLKAEESKLLFDWVVEKIDDLKEEEIDHFISIGNKDFREIDGVYFDDDMNPLSVDLHYY